MAVGQRRTQHLGQRSTSAAERISHDRPHTVGLSHVCEGHVGVADHMTGGLDAIPTGMRGDTSRSVHQRHLTGLTQGVLLQKPGEGFFRVVPASEEVQQAWTV